MVDRIDLRIPTSDEKLRRPFYARSTEQVATDLIGKALIRRIGRWIRGGIIVETEAYLHSGDLASHSARGRTRSNASMFGRPGTLYVYPIHAKYCMNAVTEPEGHGAAVLIRAMEPLWGLPMMERQRGQKDPRRLTRGPAMLCQALQIDREFDGIDLTESNALWISATSPAQRLDVAASPRIGISKSSGLALRFYAKGSRFVSRNSTRS